MSLSLVYKCYINLWYDQFCEKFEFSVKNLLLLSTQKVRGRRLYDKANAFAMGRWDRFDLAISNEFCRDGSPFGYSFLDCREETCSAVLPATSCQRRTTGRATYSPLIPVIRSAMPSLVPKILSCPMGFWSKNSDTNSRAYWSVRRNRLGLRSFSSMLSLKSRTKIRCRMIPRCTGAESCNVLSYFHQPNLSVYRSLRTFSSL